MMSAEHRSSPRRAPPSAARGRSYTATLEAANRELDAFVHSVSHELRAPLRALDGFTRLLSEHCRDRLDAKGQHYLTSIISAEQQMASLIDALLRLSRLDCACVTPREVDLRELTVEICGGLQASEAHRDVDLVVDPLPRIYADPMLMRQVLENLLANAFKYTRGRRIARIHVGYFADDDEMVLFVRDNGAGFDMRHASRLFRLFERLHGADVFEGTGVGLALVRRIIERHGGRVWAEGACDVGATLYFALPRQRCASSLSL